MPVVFGSIDTPGAAIDVADTGSGLRVIEAVPEPAGLRQLLSGAAFLALLTRLRMRSAGSRGQDARRVISESGVESFRRSPRRPISRA
jgi:hypothetical protein